MTVDIGPMIATPRAQWLPPSHWPAGSEHLFTPGPFRVDQQLPVVSRYGDVRAALLDTDQTSAQGAAVSRDGISMSVACLPVAAGG